MINNDVFLCLMTHDGLLSLFEPIDPETLKSWSQIDSFYPFGQCPRGTEARFSLSFQQSESKSQSINTSDAGDDHSAISLAVSAMNSIKVFHVTKSDDPEGNYQLYEVLTIHTDTAQINEVAWAPGCLRPYGVIAVACDDGTVRIFEVEGHDESEEASRGVAARPSQSNGSSKNASTDLRNAPSGIGAGLAGMSRNTLIRRDSSKELKYEYRQAGVLVHQDGAPVWKVRWFYDGPSLYTVFQFESISLTLYIGSALASTGDNGKVHLWRESLSGKYLEFAETEPA